MKRQQWVDHRFNLGIDLGWSKNILSRITDTEIRLTYYVSNLTDEQLSVQKKGKWSIKEHIGHLTDLETLWMNRFQQFENGLSELVAADMSNEKTKNTNHNDSPILQLLSDFKKARNELILFFQKLNDPTQLHQAYHPRLKMMMRPVDLLFFIAEHDNHHITSIVELKNQILMAQT